MEKRNAAKANIARGKTTAGQAKVLVHKRKVQNMEKRLKTESNLRKIDENIVTIFVNDLRLILEEVKKLDKVTTTTCFKGFNTFCLRLDKAITQLDVALDAASQIGKEFNTEIQTQYYGCLKNCHSYLEDALLEILI